MIPAYSTQLFEHYTAFFNRFTAVINHLAEMLISPNAGKPIESAIYYFNENKLKFSMG